MALVRPAILCGGAGTRLWPLSRTRAPKQLHPLAGPRSLLADTVARAVQVTGQEPLLITGRDIAGRVVACAREGGASAPVAILEPVGKNTAAAAAMAALAAQEAAPDAMVLLMPSDAFVADIAAFADAVRVGAALAGSGAIVTFGVRPTRPETGYGYIRQGAPLGEGFQVEAFKEKPDKATAEAYVADPRYLWNAGIYLFRADVFLNELALWAPDVSAPAAAAWAGRRASQDEVAPDAQAWDAIPSVSVDVAVAERTARIAVAPVSMGWSDVGDWAALWDIATKDQAGNAVVGDATLVEARDCYVRAGARTIVAVGVEDLVIVETPDAVLVTTRAHAQGVRLAVDKLKSSGRTDLVDEPPPETISTGPFGAPS